MCYFSACICIVYPGNSNNCHTNLLHPLWESNPSPHQWQATMLPSELKGSSRFSTASSWSEAGRKWVHRKYGGAIFLGGRGVDYYDQSYPRSVRNTTQEKAGQICFHFPFAFVYMLLHMRGTLLPYCFLCLQGVIIIFLCNLQITNYIVYTLSKKWSDFVYSSFFVAVRNLARVLIECCAPPTQKKWKQLGIDSISTYYMSTCLEFRQYLSLSNHKWAIAFQETPVYPHYTICS